MPTLVGLALLLASCDGARSDDPAVDSSFDAAVTGVYDFRMVGGASASVSTFGETRLQIMLLNAGTPYATQGGITLVHPCIERLSRGTYAIGRTYCSFLAYLSLPPTIEAPGSPRSLLYSDTGILTISEVTTTRIVGTFQFDALPLPRDSAGTTYVEGRFQSGPLSDHR